MRCNSLYKFGRKVSPSDGSFYKTHTIYELKILREFLHTSDTLGIKTPYGIEAQSFISSKITELEKSTEPAAIKLNEPILLESLALAQHHGIPTRLLDWSLDRYHSLFFAAMGRCLNPSEDNQMVLWAINYLSLDLPNPASCMKVIFAPFSSDSYLKSQKGVFTYIADAAKAYQNNDWIPHDVVLSNIPISNNIDKPDILRIKIDASLAKEILIRLHKMDITLIKIIPTLDAVAEYMKLYAIINEK